jgi:hypothetical protein
MGGCVAGSMLRKQAKTAKTAKNQMWWENAELNIIIVRVAVVIVGGRTPPRALVG